MKQFVLENKDGEMVTACGYGLTTDESRAMVFDERDNMVMKARWFTFQMTQPMTSRITRKT